MENTDVTALKESIRKIGLLNPILINEQNELLSGFRRLTACRELGWEEIEAIIIRTGEDELKKLEIEYHENLGRTDLSEIDRQNYEQLKSDILNPPKRKGLINFFKRMWDFILQLLRIKKG